VSVLLNATVPGATTAAFAPKQDFTTGTGPFSAAIGDLNGDGLPDIAVANLGNSGSNTVSVLLNTTAPGATTAAFAASQDFTTGRNPSTVAIGDLNGDGKPDLAVTNFTDGSVSVLVNTAVTGATTASFAAKQDFTTANDTRSLCIADFNGDGLPDLVTANEGSNSVSVLLNTTVLGAATITPDFPQASAQAAEGIPRSVAIGDLNGDGKPDLAIADYYSNSVSVLLNTTPPGATTSTFAARQDFTAGTHPMSVAIGDLNGDGLPDLAVANYGASSVSVLLNTTAPGASTPTFAAKQDFAVGSGPRSVAIGDLNGDGRRDIAVANEVTAASAGTVSVLLSTTVPGAATPSFAPKVDFVAGAQPLSVAVADFNGDGKPDLAVANATISGTAGTVSVLLNTTAPGGATPTFAAKADFATGPGPFSLAVADFNGDGNPDLVVANATMSANTVSVLLNTTAPGASTPTFAPKADFTTGGSPFSVAAGDLNGDGKPDLAVANFQLSATVSVLLNTTAPGASTPTFAANVDFTSGTHPNSVAIGDLNGDGRPDFAVANQGSNNMSALRNTPVTITDSTATGTIIETDSTTLPTVQFATASETVDESSAEFTFSVTVTLSAVSDTDTTVPFTLGGTAELGTDYSGITSSPLIIPAGQTSGIITGTLIDDGAPDAIKTLTFTLGTPTNATLGTTTTNTLTIGEGSAIVATGVAVNGFELSPLTDVTVATFTNGDGTEPAGDFSATIDWGDCSTSAGTVTRPQTTYIVQGSHTYTDEQTYPISIVISKTGASVTVDTTGRILEELLPDSTRGTPNQRFISEIYRDLLRRKVDPGGLTYWSGRADAGVSPLQIVLDIENDPLNEFRTLEVQDLYSQYLHRAADPLGLNGGIAFLRSGGTVEQLAAFLAGSDEYFRSRGASSNQSWEDALAQDALHRPIDSTLRATMESSFAQGMNRSEITAIILNSEEYRRDLVEIFYMRFLDRDVDSLGMTNALAALNIGWTDERVMAGVIGEPVANEFFNKTAP
jgi:hypothetical protein